MATTIKSWNWLVAYIITGAIAGLMGTDLEVFLRLVKLSHSPLMAGRQRFGGKPMEFDFQCEIFEKIWPRFEPR
jgi:hypothetical protein